MKLLKHLSIYNALQVLFFEGIRSSRSSFYFQHHNRQNVHLAAQSCKNRDTRFDDIHRKHLFPDFERKNTHESRNFNEESIQFLQDNQPYDVIESFVCDILKEAVNNHINIDYRHPYPNRSIINYVLDNSILNASSDQTTYDFCQYRKLVACAEMCILRYYGHYDLGMYMNELPSGIGCDIVELMNEKIGKYNSLFNWINTTNQSEYEYQYGFVDDEASSETSKRQKTNYSERNKPKETGFSSKKAHHKKFNRINREKNAVYITFILPQKTEETDETNLKEEDTDDKTIHLNRDENENDVKLEDVDDSSEKQSNSGGVDDSNEKQPNSEGVDDLNEKQPNSEGVDNSNEKQPNIEGVDETNEKNLTNEENIHSTMNDKSNDEDKEQKQKKTSIKRIRVPKIKPQPPSSISSTTTSSFSDVFSFENDVNDKNDKNDNSKSSKTKKYSILNRLEIGDINIYQTPTASNVITGGKLDPVEINLKNHSHGLNEEHSHERSTEANENSNKQFDEDVVTSKDNSVNENNISTEDHSTDLKNDTSKITINSKNNRQKREIANQPSTEDKTNDVKEPEPVFNKDLKDPSHEHEPLTPKTPDDSKKQAVSITLLKSSESLNPKEPSEYARSSTSINSKPIEGSSNSLKSSDSKRSTTSLPKNGSLKSLGSDSSLQPGSGKGSNASLKTSSYSTDPLDPKEPSISEEPTSITSEDSPSGSPDKYLSDLERRRALLEEEKRKE